MRGGRDQEARRGRRSVVNPIASGQRASVTDRSEAPGHPSPATAAQARCIRCGDRASHAGGTERRGGRRAATCSASGSRQRSVHAPQLGGCSGRRPPRSRTGPRARAASAAMIVRSCATCADADAGRAARSCRPSRRAGRRAFPGAADRLAIVARRKGVRATRRRRTSRSPRASSVADGPASRSVLARRDGRSSSRPRGDAGLAGSGCRPRPRCEPPRLRLAGIERPDRISVSEQRRRPRRREAQRERTRHRVTRRPDAARTVGARRPAEPRASLAVSAEVARSRWSAQRRIAAGDRLRSRTRRRTAGRSRSSWRGHARSGRGRPPSAIGEDQVGWRACAVRGQPRNSSRRSSRRPRSESRPRWIRDLTVPSETPVISAISRVVVALDVEQHDRGSLVVGDRWQSAPAMARLRSASDGGPLGIGLVAGRRLPALVLELRIRAGRVGASWRAGCPSPR